MNQIVHQITSDYFFPNPLHRLLDDRVDSAVHSGRKLRLTARVRRNYFCHSQAAKCSINLPYYLKLPSIKIDQKVFNQHNPVWQHVQRTCPGTVTHIFSSGSSPATRCHPSSCWTSKSPSWWVLFLQLANSGGETFSLQRRVAVCQIRRSCIKRITHCCGKLWHIFCNAVFPVSSSEP